MEESPLIDNDEEIRSNRSSAIFSNEVRFDHYVESLGKEFETSKSITERNFLGTENGFGSPYNLNSGSHILITEQSSKVFNYTFSPLVT